MMRICILVGESGIALATRSLAIATKLPPEPANQGAFSFHCVARASLDDGIQEHFTPSFFQLRMICNRGWEWMVALFVRLLTATIGNPSELGRIDVSFHFFDGGAPGTVAVMTEETAGLLALEISI